MKLPALDQTIELAPGEAGQLAYLVASVWMQAGTALMGEEPQPVEAALLLALPVLHSLGTRLGRVQQAERRRVGPPLRRPRRFRLSCQEVVAVMQHVLPAAPLLTRPLLGKVQQKSLNLERYVKFGAC